MKRPRGKQAKNGGARTGEKRARKHISFARDPVKVRFVKPPPRSMNHRYWFTETESVVKKGLTFEVEPGIDVSVDVDCRMQLTSLSLPPGGSSPAGGRSYLEVRQNPSLGAARRGTPWLTVASVAEGCIEKLRVILSVGSYTLRCVGKKPVQVFSQVWDFETRLS